MPHEEDGAVSRRSVIAAATLVPVTAITAAAQAAASVFSPSQARILEAFVDRLIPRDDHGPGAVECGVVSYIDRSLAGPLAAEKAALIEGLAAVDALARGSHGGPFAELAPDKRDEVLRAFESGASRAFFNRVLRLTREGMFSDPYYGGNKGFAGWDLIRYPGPRLAVSPDEQKLREPIKAVRSSAYGGRRGN
jgi:gluconate 2-dehydrogenase gamma chain